MWRRGCPPGLVVKVNPPEPGTVVLAKSAIKAPLEGKHNNGGESPL